MWRNQAKHDHLAQQSYSHAVAATEADGSLLGTWYFQRPVHYSVMQEPGPDVFRVSLFSTGRFVSLYTTTSAPLSGSRKYEHLGTWQRISPGVIHLTYDEEPAVSDPSSAMQDLYLRTANKTAVKNDKSLWE